MALKILFVCHFGAVRSPTASELYAKDYNTDYIGIDDSQRAWRREKLLWADIVIVMAQDIETALKKEFPTIDKLMYNVDIRDIYGRKNHPDLIIKLKEKIDPILHEHKWSTYYERKLKGEN